MPASVFALLHGFELFFAVFAVPCPALLASVPFGSVNTCAVQVFNYLFMVFAYVLSRMIRGVFADWHTGKVFNVVVVLVLVLVVDVKSVGNGAIEVPPYIAMQPFSFALIGGFAG